jgi:hypothetical protein
MAKTPEEKRAADAERKRKQRKREELLDMKPFVIDLAVGERRMIEENAQASGFEDQTEYLFSLVLADRKALDAADPGWRDRSQINETA